MYFFRTLTLLFLTCCFAAPAIAEDKLGLSQYKGEVVYVDFWASWCTPCKQSFPWMDQMHKKYHTLGLNIIAVNLDEDPALADQFLSKHPISFKTIKDPEGVLAEKYQVQGMPTALLFNKDGKLIDQHIGFNPKKSNQYEAILRKALAAHDDIKLSQHSGKKQL